MLTQLAAIDIARQFVTECRSIGVPIEHAYLFGSYAQDKANDYSDIDVVLTGNTFTGSPLIDKVDIRKIIIQKPFHDIQVLTFSNDYFLSGEDAFIEEEIKPNSIQIA